MNHILKTDPAVFQAIADGAQTYTIRFNDRAFAVGDELLLRETASSGDHMQLGAPLEYTGRELTKTVSHVLGGYGLGEGWVNLSFASASPAPASVDAMLPAVRALFAEIFDSPVGNSELDVFRNRVIYALTDYVGAVARKAVGENPKLLAIDEYHAAMRMPADVPAQEERPLTRYDLYALTHERRIKPMPAGRYYLASDADQRLEAAVTAAREAGGLDALRKVGALLGLSGDANLQAILETGAAEGAVPTTINSQEFRDLVHAYAACPSDIKPLVEIIERYKDSAVGHAMQSISKAVAAGTPAAHEAGRLAMLDQVGSLFGIGRDARNLGVIETNIQNLVRRFECLGAIEREFFMVPGEQDDDAPGVEPDEVCLLNWGASPADYVEQFRVALAVQFGHLAAGPTVAWATLDDDGKLFHATCFSHEAAQHAQNGRQLVTLMLRPVETKAAAALAVRNGLPDDLAQAICRVARDRGLGLAIRPVREFLLQHGHASSICVRELSVGDTVEVLPGCQTGDEDFGGRRGVVRGFEVDGMTGFDVEFFDGGGVFAARGDLEFGSAATADPLMMPLPCDIQVGQGIHRKGTPLLALVSRMHSLYALADAAGPNSFHYDAEHPDDGLNAPGAPRAGGATELALHLALAHAEQVLPAGHSISIEVQRGRSGVDWEGPSGRVFMNACGSLTHAVREATRAALEVARGESR